MKRPCLLVLLLSVPGAWMPASLHAAKPWERLIPFKKVEADPDKAYRLTKDHGPWLILASSFAGPGAEQQARDLVLQLRKDFNLEAYLHDQTYDFTERVTGLGLDRYGYKKKMRYANAAKFKEIAVLVGNFQTVEDPKVEKVLKTIKYAHPSCLDLSESKASTQRFAGLRELHRLVSTDPEKRKKGPMGNAFVTRNPLLPQEYFTPKGVDPLVESMNREVEYSLLKNRKKYSVRVASFRSASTMKVAEIEKNGANLPSKLEQAAVKAHELTLALRKEGWEAYEFHDRFESIVTVGSFDSLGAPRADGKTEINPEVHRVMKELGAKRQQLPGRTQVGLVPKSVGGMTLDVQPVPVEVPQRSIATAYAPSRRLFQ